jgi:ankyrin repeat protein
MANTRQDIVVLKQNKKGNDLVIGDIHGSHKNFITLIESLEPYDRLFLVGDLTDRGPGSVKVIEAIVADQAKDAKAGRPPRINVVRGNHEDLCLESISALEIIANKDPDLLTKFAKLTKIMDRMEPDFITQYFDSLLKDEKYKELHKEISSVQLHLINGGKWLVDLFITEFNTPSGSDSKVTMIKDFMSKLPYITHVTGSKPFNIVHADMPFDDRELQKRINRKNFILNDQEIFHAIWARLTDDTMIKDNNRKKDSIMTIVGHNIIGEYYSVVREKTNTIDLDVGAYYNDVFLVLNLTKGKCEFVGKNSENFDVQIYLDAKKMLEAHLKKIQFGISPLYRAAKEGNLNAVTKLLNKKDIEVNKLNYHGNTALYVAAQYGQAAVVEKLLAVPRIDANQKNLDGLNPLLIAATNEHALVMKALLKVPGIDVSIKDSNGNNALLYVTEDGNLELAAEFVKVPGIINLPDNDGYTPLMIAVNQRNLAMVELLLNAADIDVNIPDAKGDTAIMDATKLEEREIVKKLLTVTDIDVNHSARNGDTLLELAEQNGWDDIVDIITELQNNDQEKKVTEDHLGQLKSKSRISQNAAGLFQSSSPESDSDNDGDEKETTIKHTH